MSQTVLQQTFPMEGILPWKQPRTNHHANKLAREDRAFHDWYRFVLSFPPHLVRGYLERFSVSAGQTVLDPFCGTGTTVVESRLQGMHAIGLEAMPMAHFASSIKVSWDIDPDALQMHAADAADAAYQKLRADHIDDKTIYASVPEHIRLRHLSPQLHKLLIKNSISPMPLHKILTLLECLRPFENMPHYNHMRLALAKMAVASASNLRFGPEIGVGRIKTDAQVIAPWLEEVCSMCGDLRMIEASLPSALIHHSDSRCANKTLNPASVDAVITSPPYPNEKDYSRTMRLESVLLGIIGSKEELRSAKKRLVRSNTRGVYVQDDDDRWAKHYPAVVKIAETIEQRRKDLNKTSGFERQYARVTMLYFGGMAKHLANLRPVLRPGARLAYVVGDQASYLRVMIRTGKLLTEIAHDLGYEVENIDLFRTRFSTATGKQLREEVVVLRWPGAAGN